MTTAFGMTIGVGAFAAIVLAALLMPALVGGVAGSLLGYGFAKGAGAGLAFSIIAGAVRGIVGMAAPAPPAPLVPMRPIF